MKKEPNHTIKTPDLSRLSAAELRLVMAQMQQQQQQFQTVIDEQNARLLNQDKALDAAHRRIELLGVVSENGIYGHSRFCNTDFDDKLACLNLSGV
ncbi:TPA: hypothetical protein ACM3G7_004655 [Escherichia coli]|nr:hypothetical protein [Escherichia coli]HCR1930699.1 hypothetical protein [Enterobacter roggenkampii]HDT5136991.1 hypothetical protein [Escherichia coli]